MKYLKLFEDKSQKEDIELVFSEFLDTQYQTEDGETESEAFIEDQEKYFLISITKQSVVPQNITSSEEFSEFINGKSEDIKFLNKIKICLDRLTYLGYRWAFSYDENSWEFYIQVYHKESKLDLNDCFDRGKYVNENNLKKVLKDDYNVEYTSMRFQEGTSGYYGRRAEILIYVKNPIQPDNKLISDLKSVTKSYDVITNDGRGKRTEKAFYNVELVTGHGNRTIRITL